MRLYSKIRQGSYEMNPNEWKSVSGEGISHHLNFIHRENAIILIVIISIYLPISSKLCKGIDFCWSRKEIDCGESPQSSLDKGTKQINLQIKSINSLAHIVYFSSYGMVLTTSILQHLLYYKYREVEVLLFPKWLKISPNITNNWSTMDQSIQLPRWLIAN